MSEFGGYPVPPEAEANLLKWAAGTIHSQSNEIDRLTAQCEALRADAERLACAVVDCRNEMLMHHRSGDLKLTTSPEGEVAYMKHLNEKYQEMAWPYIKKFIDGTKRQHEHLVSIGLASVEGD